MSDARPAAQSTAPVDLALAICHEVGNLVGAVRLHTHLIDDEMTRRDLARVTIEVDDLCARSAAMLTHIRPLLTDPRERPDPVAPLELLASVRDVMADQGGRGVRMDRASLASLPALLADREVLHHLLQSLVFAALEAAGPEGSISLAAERTPDGVAVVVEDDGPVGEDPSAWRTQARRGRPLLLSVADAIARRFSGALEVTREAGLTRVVLTLPVGPDAA